MWPRLAGRSFAKAGAHALRAVFGEAAICAQSVGGAALGRRSSGRGDDSNSPGSAQRAALAGRDCLDAESACRALRGARSDWGVGVGVCAGPVELR